MKVSDALDLMEKNPSVDFPWEGTLIGLINSFLPVDNQLDPFTAELAEISEAFENMDANTRKMLHNTQLVEAIDVPEVDERPARRSKKKNPRQKMFVVFGVVVCICALIMASRVGNGVEGGDLTEMIKVIVSVLLPALIAP